MERVIRVGSRDSALAVAQAKLVMDAVKRQHPDIALELITMKTTGDQILDRRLDEIGGKGLFVKELDRALLEGRIDISVHSLKDLPTEIPEELPIAAYSKRDDPRDALVLKPGYTEVKADGITGTSSRRRGIQLHSLYPEMKIENIRGNLQTRLKKLEEEPFDQVILAAAGLKRMGKENEIFSVFSPEVMIPAAGQGILAVQARKGEEVSFLACVNDKASETAAAAERSFVRAFGGGCSSPIAAYARVRGNELKLSGFYALDYGKSVTGEIVGEAERAQALGEELARRLRQRL